MARFANNGEGGTNGTTVSPGNSGGASGTAWDLVSISAGATLTYDTAQAEGALGYKIVIPGTSGVVAFVEWGTVLGSLTTVFVRVYLYMTGFPAGGTLRLIRFLNGATEDGVVIVNTAGQLQLRDAAGAIAGNTTAVMNLNQWVRIEGTITCNATTGSIEARLFNSPDATAPTETITKTARNTGTLVNKVDIGETNVPGAVTGRTFWIDDIAIDTAAYPGPARANGAAFPMVGAAVASASGLALREATAALVGVASAVAGGSTIAKGNATLTGIARLTAGGANQRLAAAALAGVAGLASTGRAQRRGIAALIGIADLEGAAAGGAVHTVRMFGAPGSFHGMDALANLDSGDDFNAVAVTGWAFHAGKTAGWGVATDGKLFMAGQDQAINALRTRGTDYPLSIFDPAVPSLTHVQVPTSTGDVNVVGANGLSGGAYGADVVAMPVHGETCVVMMSTAPYNWFNPWSIAAHGVYPVLAVFRKMSGVWTYWPAWSIYASDLHANSTDGSKSFPAATNSFGETYYDTQLLGEIEYDPASGHLIGVQYGRPIDPAFDGGTVIAIDVTAKAVVARYAIPFVSQAGFGQICPRALTVGPGGLIGCVFDCFDLGGSPAPTNVAQLFQYDPTAPGPITPLSNWLAPTADCTHFSHCAFDGNGGWWLARRNGTLCKSIAYFPNIGGVLKPMTGSFAFDGTFGIRIAPDIALGPLEGTQAAIIQTRFQWDPTLGVMWGFTGNEQVVGFAIEGDTRAPRVTRRGFIDLGAQTYLKGGATPEPGTLWPMDAAIDVGARMAYFPLGQLSPNAYPAAPELHNAYVYVADIGKLGVLPTYVDAAHHASLTQATFTIPRPQSWPVGAVAIAYIMCALNSSDALISPPAGWTRIIEESNDAVGHRYASYWHAIAAGEGDPTFTPPRGVNWIGNLFVAGDVDTTSPILGSASVKAASGSTITRPAVGGTAGLVIGCYGIVGLATFSALSGEVPRESQSGIFGAGFSTLITSEEALGPGAARSVIASLGAKHEGQTIVLRRAGAPAAPLKVASLVLSPTKVVQGGTASGVVALTAPPPVDTVVSLSADKPNKAIVPGTVTVPAGASSARFPILVPG